MPVAALRQQIQTGSALVTFLGAGASVDSGGRTADSVAFDLLTRVYGQVSRARLLSAFKRDYGQMPSFETVLEALGNAKSERTRLLLKYFDDMEPSEGYQLLATLLKSGYLNPIVLTTNFDCMLEKALESDSVEGPRLTYRVVTGDEIIPGESPSANEIMIVKLHGDLRRPETLRITREETADLPRTTIELVRTMYELHGFLIIGYRGADTGIQSALAGADARKNSIYWVTKDSVEDIRSGTFLLDSIRKQGNLGDVFEKISFDDFMVDLVGTLPAARQRSVHAPRIDAVWRSLDRARSFGASREADLSKALDATVVLEHDVDLPEVHAQVELIRFETDPNGETYRLLQATDYLAAASKSYAGWLPENELSIVELEYLAAQLNIFHLYRESRRLTGTAIDEIIDRSRRLHTNTPHAHLFLKLKAGCVLVEALKEKAMITANLPEHKSFCEECQKLSLKLVKDISAKDHSDAIRLRGTLYRHLAITYELQGDSSSDEGPRQQAYVEWRRLSRHAAELLEPIGEDRVRGYALMNACSSLTRLSSSVVGEHRRRTMLQEGRDEINVAISCLAKVSDSRGIAWARIHKCENLRKAIDVASSDQTRQDLAVELEITAKQAIASLRFVTDRQAIGLAYKELGIALLMVHQQSKRSAIVRVKRAVALLEDAAHLLSDIAVFRGEGEAYLWLSRGVFELWQLEHEEIMYVRCIENLLRGLLSTSIGLDRIKGLEQTRAHLDRELQNLL